MIKAMRLTAFSFLFMTTPLLADLVSVGPVPFDGSGLGAVNTILTIGDQPTESGCLAYGGPLVGDIIGPTACPAGHPALVGGDEKTGESQTQTRPIGAGTAEDPGLNLVNASQLRVVLNLNENEFNPVSVTDMVLTIYDENGTLVFTSEVFNAGVPVIDLFGQGGIGSAGYVFQLTPAQAATAQAVFDADNRIGLSATLSGTTAGFETFFVADVGVIGAPLETADVGVTKVGSASVIAGENITYTSTVTNVGTTTAEGVEFRDTISASTEFVSVVEPVGVDCTFAAGTLTCPIGTMLAGETEEITYTVRSCPEADCAVDIQNNARVVTTGTFDPTVANNQATATTTVQAQSDLGITKTAAQAVAAGSLVNFVITVTNFGPSNSINNVVNDILPAGFTAVDVTTTAGNCTGEGTGTVNCTIAELGGPNQCETTFPTTATITITARAGGPLGTTDNTATVTSGNCLADANTTNNTGTTRFDVTVAAGIPTLSEWGLFATAMLLAGFAFLRLRT